MIFNIFVFIVGLLMLFWGAGWLVKGSSSLARTMGLKPIIIGLTVVAFGTSAPELVISVVSSIKAKSMIALGNVIGSNICNIALVLAVTVLINPVKSSPSAIRRDIPIMLAVSLYLLLLSLDSQVSRFEGATLFSGVILYIYYNYYTAVRELPEEDNPLTVAYDDPESVKIGHISSRPKQILLIVSGILCVVLGAEALIDSSVKIMKVFGVSEKFIGLTVVAFGTSLPELATSLVAALKKEMDISIGNLIGSNIFNILSVVGAAAMVRPIMIPGGFIESGLLIDYMVMMATSLLTWILMRKTFTMTRLGGLLLLGCYSGYLVYLIIWS